MRTGPSQSMAISAVRSVDPSSTTTISNGGTVWAWMARTVAAMNRASLWAATTTLTLGAARSAFTDGK